MIPTNHQNVTEDFDIFVFRRAKFSNPTGGPETFSSLPLLSFLYYSPSSVPMKILLYNINLILRPSILFNQGIKATTTYIHGAVANRQQTSAHSAPILIISKSIVSVPSLQQ